MTIYQKLSAVQNELKAPKNLYNSFGKYSYRNAESIYESAKPLLAKHGLVLYISDDINQIGDRYYIKAVAKVVDVQDATCVEVTAYARESLDKKGMDDSQITGACSSYARKYALNGLFLLDDTKDADTDEFHQQTHRDEEPASSHVVDGKPMATEKQIKFIKNLGNQSDDAKAYIKTRVHSWDALTMAEANEIIEHLKK